MKAVVQRVVMVMLVVASSTMLFVGCDSNSAPTDPVVERCLTAADLHLETGNWWIYETQEAQPLGAVQTFTDSMVVVSTIQLDGVQGHVLHIYRNGEIIDTLTMSTSTGQVLVRDDFFTTSLSVAACRPIGNRWYDIDHCPISGTETVRIDSVVGPSEELPSLGPDGEIVMSRIDRNVVYKALRPVSLQTTTMSIVEYHEMKLVSPDSAVFDPEVVGNSAQRSDDGRTLWWTREHVLRVESGKGIVYWMHTDLQDACTQSAYIRRTLLRTNVGS
ncbi:MAG TPA: hypothetical protein PLW14_12785 [Chlorobiota bacterium]|nr:hypothetical protein [Chlorobiota bacterium]